MNEMRLNQDYGSGVFRRHVLIELQDPHSVFAALEDDAHAFTLSMRHDGSHVTGIEAHWVRHPSSTCPGAVDQLQSMVGCPLGTNPLALRKHTQHLAQCTHFFDLCSLMITHACHSAQPVELPKRTLYRANIGDEQDGRNHAILWRNDEKILQWFLRNGVIEGDGDDAGQNPLRGMTSWACQHLDDDAISAMVLLQKALFVAFGRRFQFSKLVGEFCKNTGQPIGSCYALRDGRENTSKRLDSRRDLSASETDILRFVDAAKPSHG